MKHILIAFACCALLAAPAFAQEQEDPNEKSTEELYRELQELMKKASVEMDELKGGLAKSSLGPAKPDIVSEHMQRIRTAMEDGSLDEIPEGLREYLAENPDEAAELTGKSAEEFRKLAEDADELEAILRKHPEVLKKLAESEDAFEKIVENQIAVEKRVASTLEKARAASESAEQRVDESLDIAHVIRSRSS